MTVSAETTPSPRLSEAVSLSSEYKTAGAASGLAATVDNISQHLHLKQL